MQKLLTLALLALVTAAVAAPSAVTQPNPPQGKVWLCHKTGGTFTNGNGTFVKFVAIRVSTRAQAKHHLRHGDILVAPAPSGNVKAQRQAAKAFCGAQRVMAPMTPTQGGVPQTSNLSDAAKGVTANLVIRAQVGHQRLCFSLTNVTGPAGATISLSSLTLVQGSTTLATIPAAQLTGTSPSGCITLASKDVAKQVLKGNVSVTLGGTLTPGGAFSATGTL